MMVRGQQSCKPTGSGRRAAAACLGLLTLFAGVAWLSVRGRCATYDEVLHAPIAWMHLRYLDFRGDCENPPLWKYWAALPQALRPPVLPANEENWRVAATDGLPAWKWGIDLLYRTPGNDADAMINRSRAMMLVVGLALGGLIAGWSWRLGGAAAAVAATAWYCLDPTVLAHAALVKNDVSFALAFTGAAAVCWKLGRRVTWLWVCVLGIVCGAALCVKFSALLLAPVVIGLFAARAMMADPWMVLDARLLGRGGKLLAAMSLCAVVGVISYASIWACYGFRFLPTADPAISLNIPRALLHAAVGELEGKNQGVAPTAGEMDAWEPPLLIVGIVMAEQNHWLPQAWLAGLLVQYSATHANSAFLCGRLSSVGWWYYFPLAMLFKMPLATLAAGLGAIVIALGRWRGAGGSVLPLLRASPTRADEPPVAQKEGLGTGGQGRSGAGDRLWTALCLLLPPVMYCAVAMGTHLNLGVRHMLPVFPFMFIGIGVAAARVWQRSHVYGRAAVVALGVGLAAESLASFPHYLSFFNAAVGGPRHGIYLLGDSNLDWGQDLKLLAEWQRGHPTTKLYLSYFGMADPAYYGIRYTNLPGGYTDGPPMQRPSEPGVLAISASKLQGVHMAEALRGWYGRLMRTRPREVLGASIYLYDFPGEADAVVGGGPVAE